MTLSTTPALTIELRRARAVWAHLQLLDEPANNTREALLRAGWLHAIGGVDGSLQGRFPTGPARGNVRAKTGTVSNASTLSGYVTSAAGTPLAFVIMGNHYTVPTAEIRAAQDEVVELLARYQR